MRGKLKKLFAAVLAVLFGAFFFGVQRADGS